MAAHLLVARLCSEATKSGAEFLHGGGGDGPSKLYERVAIGMSDRACYLSGRAFQLFAGLDGLPVREIVRRLSPESWGGNRRSDIVGHTPGSNDDGINAHCTDLAGFEDTLAGQVHLVIFEVQKIADVFSGQ